MQIMYHIASSLIIYKIETSYEKVSPHIKFLSTPISKTMSIFRKKITEQRPVLTLQALLFCIFSSLKRQWNGTNGCEKVHVQRVKIFNGKQ